MGSDAAMRRDGAYRVGVPALGAAGVEQKVVEVPQRQTVVTLGPARAAIGSLSGLEGDLAIDQQGKELHAGETLLPAQLADLLG